jgi:hypothetical protein
MDTGFEQQDQGRDINDIGLELTRRFEKILQHTCMDIFASYRSVLLDEPLTYTVAAIWGAQKWGKITTTQLEINSRVSPAVEQMQLALESGKLDQEQVFVREYMIRGLIIAKILYMSELYKKIILTKEAKTPTVLRSLQWIEPLGTA